MNKRRKSRWITVCKKNQEKFTGKPPQTKKCDVLALMNKAAKKGRKQ